ncbi:hypothetical protein PTKIN_Ptkin15bG0132100 [Pterospermum kingtungense]
MMETRLPQSKLKAEPHNESRVKTLKKQYNAIAKMLALGSGFQWDDVEKCLTASKDVFDDWSHPNAKGLMNTAFPHYDDCATIFGRDRATGLGAETAGDAVEQIRDSADDDSTGAKKKNETLVVGTMEDVHGSTGATSATSKRIGSHKSAMSSDGTNELVEHLAGIKNIYEDSMQDMRTFFWKEYEGIDKRLALPQAIEEMEGFVVDEIIKVEAYMSKDPTKLDYFFALNPSRRSAYVKILLEECCPSYRPSFDHFGSGDHGF